MIEHWGGDRVGHAQGIEVARAALSLGTFGFPSYQKTLTWPWNSNGHTLMEAETLEALLTEQEIRQQMSDIKRRYTKERRNLKVAYWKLAKKTHRAYLAVTFQEAHLLTRPEAKEYLEKAKGQKLIKEDKLAIQALEIEPEQLAYDLAKFDCDTSDKEYDKLEKQLSYYQSLMKFTGPTERT